MPDESFADAPGRVNLIGEHTDYHQGFVLPTTIPQRTQVHLIRRGDVLVRARSSACGGDWQEYELGGEAAGRGWLDFVQGTTAALVQRGFPLAGFDASIESTIPIGAGLSSSAALEVSLLRALRSLFALELDDVALARIAQSIETGFVGAPVGIMDQMCSSLGRTGDVLFLDTRTLAVERLPLPASVDLVVIDSGVKHQHAGGGYGDRRRESFEAAARLGLDYLRDASPAMLPLIAELPDTLARRARHIVTENQRVLESVEAIRSGDPVRLGRLFAASHASLRDDYEVSTGAVDVLVDLGQQHDDVFGARMTGGGFGGAVVLIARRGRGRQAAEEICAAYGRRTTRAGSILLPVIT